MRLFETEKPGALLRLLTLVALASSAPAQMAREAKNQEVGVPTTIEGWVPKIDGVFGKVERTRVLMGELVPKVSGASKEIAESVRDYRNNRTRENRARMMTVAAERMGDLKGALKTTLTEQEALELVFENQQKSFEAELGKFDAKEEGLRGEARRAQKERARIEQQASKLKKRKREALDGGAPLTAAEERRLLTFYKRRLAQVRGEDKALEKLANAEVERQIVGRLAKKLGSARAQLIGLQDELHKFSDKLEVVADRLALYVKWDDHISLISALRDVRGTLLQLGSEQAGFEEALDELKLAADIDEPGNDPDPKSNEALFLDWVRQEDKPAQPTTNGGGL